MPHNANNHGHCYPKTHCEGEGSPRLQTSLVENRVQQPRYGKEAEVPERHLLRRISQDVHQPGHGEGGDILNVVQVIPRK